MRALPPTRLVASTLGSRHDRRARCKKSDHNRCTSSWAAPAVVAEHARATGLRAVLVRRAGQAESVQAFGADARVGQLLARGSLELPVQELLRRALAQVERGREALLGADAALLLALLDAGRAAARA
jgi:hypothetical protein